MEFVSRALYDNELEWDNTCYLSYKLGSDKLITNVLPVPWASGNSQSAGIPNDWFDKELLNPDPTQRLYSRANGWELVYSNLLEPGLRNKYFALYNKYTGIMRMFFYAMESTSGYGTSTTFAGIQAINSSILNFAYSDSKAMDYRPVTSVYVFAPSCDFGEALASNVIDGKSIVIPGVSYKSNNWYGLELECAYDDCAPKNSNLNVKLWAADISMTRTEGTSIGDVVGNISTTYSNVPSFDLSLSFSNSNSVTVSQSIYNSSLVLGDKMAKELASKDPFFTGIWNKIKIEAPSIVSQGVKAGISSLFTGGASMLTNTAGKLLNSVLGLGKEKTMTSLSDVKLKTNATLEFESSSETVIGGWGEIKDLPLPGCGNTTALYNERLGVWNISATPTATVDMFSTSYFKSTSIIPLRKNWNC